MTEGQWLGGGETDRMLHWARRNHRGTGEPYWFPSDRKLRLFACACCRLVWHLLTDERSRRAVEVAERYADGLATEDQLEAEGLEAVRTREATRGNPGWTAAYAASLCLVRAEIFDPAEVVYNVAKCDVPPAVQAALLREVFGNPFRPVGRPFGEHPLVTDADYGRMFEDAETQRRWLDPAVLALARAAYEERGGTTCPACGGKGRGVYGLEETPWECQRCDATGFTGSGLLDPARLQVLGDALEEAGCPDGDLLRHLQGAGPHVRGCWALDLVLGRDGDGRQGSQTVD